MPRVKEISLKNTKFATAAQWRSMITLFDMPTYKYNIINTV